jgi:hypothetical protein
MYTKITGHCKPKRASFKEISIKPVCRRIYCSGVQPGLCGYVLPWPRAGRQTVSFVTLDDGLCNWPIYGLGPSGYSGGFGQFLCRGRAVRRLLLRRGCKNTNADQICGCSASPSTPRIHTAPLRLLVPLYAEHYRYWSKDFVSAPK